MRRVGFNLAGDYKPFLRRCADEGLWIHTNQRWHGPYDWAYVFGVSFFGLDWKPKLADPRQLIADARSKELTEKQAIAVDKFEQRVNAYYNSGKDALLLKSIETGLWQYPT
jgi:hypothetical protein